MELNNLNKQSKPITAAKSAERKSVYKEPEKKPPSRDYSTNTRLHKIDDDKDWDAIDRFNVELHMQEIMEDEERKRMQKMMIKTELDKQEREKRIIEEKMKQELNQYQNMKTKHLKLLDTKEEQKKQARKAYILSEKEKLDKQIREEAQRKKLEKEMERKYEREYVQRIQREIYEEREAMRQKKEFEREYHKKLMQENEQNKRKQMQELELNRKREKTDMINYAKLFDQQEANKHDEQKYRERKTQMLRSGMADATIYDMNKRKKEEKLKELQFQQEKEFRDHFDEEERLKQILENKKEMRDFLFAPAITVKWKHLGTATAQPRSSRPCKLTERGC